MPTYYEISPTNDKLSFSNGKASASFTVRYVGDRTVEAQARAKALQGARDEWLEVEPPATREMASDQTQNVKVNVTVPADTPAGDYALRLDMVSVDNTDEEYDQGPTVAFRVTEPESPAPDSSGFPWWIVAVLAVVLVLAAGGGTWYALSGDKEGIKPVTAKNWIDSYQGRIDGRDADLEIEAGDTEQSLQLTQRDLARGDTNNGQANVSQGDQAHIITAPFNNRDEMMMLHRHNRDLISIKSTWKGIPFGRAFKAKGFNRDPGSNFNDNRWQAYWNGTFQGWTDGLESQLKTTVNNKTVELTLTLQRSDDNSTTFTGKERLTPGNDPKWMHVLEGVTLRSEDQDKTFTINELLIHTWGSNYVTGIAENNAGETVGQIFIREDDVTLGTVLPPPMPLQPEVILNNPLGDG